MRGRAALAIEPLGDSALLVVLGTRADDQLTARVHQLLVALVDLHTRDPRFGRPVPALTSVLVPVDPLDPGVERAVDILAAAIGRAGSDGLDPRAGQAAPIEIPVHYGGEDGPDLADVAARLDLRPADVVEIHASVTYVVQFLGFAPGFAYLGTVPPSIVTPRLATPRPRVPAGSVALAGPQTAVYPFDSPGGWRLIGRTDVRVWDASTDPPALLLPGRRVRFVPLSR